LSTTLRRSKAQEAMSILVALGKPRATGILKYFKNDEKRTLLNASNGLPPIGQVELERLISKLESDFTTGAGILDTSELMDDIFTSAITPEEMAALNAPPVEQLVEEPVEQSIWEQLEKEGDTEIAAFIQSENHQAGAYLLTQLSGQKSASVIAALDRAARSSVITRMMSMGTASASAIRVMERQLGAAFAKGDKSLLQAGNSRVANILNQLDRPVADEVLNDMQSAFEPDRVSAVKSMLFRFEDVVQLAEADRMAVFDQIQPPVLTLALRNAETPLVEIVLAAIGARARRMIENELKTAINAKPADISDARRQIVSAVLRLSGEGRITLPSQDLAA
jgi:flagellar motor switch protein FliG